jgi:EAL domain-containing protein (putative c-di-GMP-specific phosphodiesterase class I)
MSSPRVLVVDDDPDLLELYGRALAGCGLEVETAPDGRSAEALLGGAFDAIVSDVHMPGLDGVQLLRAVRERDLDVPVLLNTADPGTESAIQAVELGALRYLVKPVPVRTLRDAVQDAVRLRRLAALRRQAAEALGLDPGRAGDRAGLHAQLDRALAGLRVARQPVVRVDGSTHAYEFLLRSSEATLPDPPAVLAAAERLGRVGELGRAVRARVAACFPEAPVLAFVNVHPLELADDLLGAADDPLAPFADRVVLEVTERASLEGVVDVRARVRALREAGYRIAVDDLGAGYAGLTSFAALQPDVVKLDRELVSGVDGSAVKTPLVRSLAALCRELGMQVVAEGIETPAERDTCAALGCELLQGYLIGRPVTCPTS